MACRLQYARDIATLIRHPCQQAADFLPCARPPDVFWPLPPLSRPRQRAHPGSHARVLMTTRAGTDTMPRRGTNADEDDIAEADHTAGASTFGGVPSVAQGRSHRLLPLPADLRMLLRDWIFEELGPAYMWIIMLSVVEWNNLTDEKKELHCTMRASWLSSYSKASHSVLQHWLWKFLEDKTKGFAPLHKVFAKIKVDSPNSGTAAWTEIFLLYPVTGASIAHKHLARGLRMCLGFKDDSTAAATDYIASINVSV
jgi:hypothetical protein